MDIVVKAVNGAGVLTWGAAECRCALGAGGITAAKREGDKATPLGCFALRRLFYRADRMARPQTGLTDVVGLDMADGWCDAPGDARYNRLVRHPYPASAERLWRDDGLYDIVVVLGYNDNPVVPGSGSAIFLHVARPDYGPTEGCVALALPDLRALLRDCDDRTRLCVRG